MLSAGMAAIGNATTSVPAPIGRAQTAPSGAGGPLAPAAAVVVAPAAVELKRWSRANSPGWYQVWAALTVLALVLLSGLGTVAAARTATVTSRIRSHTAPALLSVQDLSASLAEANAAATGAFLSGTTGAEDRSQRNLYLDDLSRSSAQTEQLAALVDDQASHEALRTVSSALLSYSGKIEASRRESQLGGSGSETTLRSALGLASNDMAGATGAITERSQARFA